MLARYAVTASVYMFAETRGGEPEKCRSYNHNPRSNLLDAVILQTSSTMPEIACFMSFLVHGPQLQSRRLNAKVMIVFTPNGWSWSCASRRRADRIIRFTPPSNYGFLREATRIRRRRALRPNIWGCMSGSDHGARVASASSHVLGASWEGVVALRNILRDIRS